MYVEFGVEYDHSVGFNDTDRGLMLEKGFSNLGKTRHCTV